MIVYWRSAFAELLAGALLPLLLLYVLRSDEDGDKGVVPLAVIVAAAWLTNIPAAVMVNYSLALLFVILAILRRSPRILIRGALAVLLGAALAAFFLIPAAYEQKWVNIGEVLSPGVRPQDNFLFTNINDADHNRFNFLVSLVASGEMIVLAIAVFCSRAWERRDPRLWWTLFGWGLVAALLNFSFSSFLWVHLPELRYLQLPWRWLLCLNVAFTLLLTMSWRRWLARVLVCTAMLLLLGFVGQRIQPPWWEKAEDFSQMLDASRAEPGTKAPMSTCRSRLIRTRSSRTLPAWLSMTGAAPDQQITIQRWNAESKSFTAEVSQPGQLVLRLFNYPAWRVEVNGHLEATAAREVTGQMLIPIQAGESHVEITFVRTWDRTAGGIISVFTALLLGGLVIHTRLKNGGWHRDSRV